MKILKTLFILFLLCSNVFAQSEDSTLLPDLTSQQTLSVLNEKLRQTDRSIMLLSDTYATNSALSAKFDTSTGHDHDGTDSKKILVTNLDTTGLTDQYYLKVNSGAVTAVSLPNVAYSTGFGNYVSKTVGTVYQAETDGIIMTAGDADSAGTLAYVDGNNPPTTLIMTALVYAYQVGDPPEWRHDTSPITFAVKKNNYYKVVGGGTMVWMPIQ